MGMTISEKIFSRACNRTVKAGDIVLSQVDLIMMHDLLGPMAVQSFEEMGFDKVACSEKVVAVFDHLVPSPSETYSKMHSILREFTAKLDIKTFDIGCGICHQLILEQGLINPGDIVIGSDSHTCTYGALNAFATGVGSTDIAAAMSTGKLWFKVPHSIKVVINGSIPKGVYSKDIILYIIGKLGINGANYQAIEFSGEALKQISMEERLTISNMAIEMGAKAGLMEIDGIACEWIMKRVKKEIRPIAPDSDAEYQDILMFDVGNLEPQIAIPHSVDSVVPISEVLGTPIQQAVLGTYKNGMLEDFRIARLILSGKKIAKGVRVIVVPASRQVLIDAIREGIIEDLLLAGCTLIAPGCGPCVGAHGGVPSDGENVISSSNRNFKGRMGNGKAFIFLASPAAVAAAAIEGRITDPRKYMEVR